MKNPAKSYKPSSTAAYKPMTASQRENANWQAKIYRDFALTFYNTASYEPASKPVVYEVSKSEVKAVVNAAKKVRHNPAPMAQPKDMKFVMVGGKPYKMKDGVLVPMTPAKDSKKWDIVPA